MTSLLLELLTSGQRFSPIQVKGENMTHLVTAYQRKYVEQSALSSTTYGNICIPASLCRPTV